ncbi:unnamed protein product [Amoebophrya sp. A25]|nr:unnamed protein product [Amoebophrya sp. A25]|eukprot:GSA25T00007067001.1
MRKRKKMCLLALRRDRHDRRFKSLTTIAWLLANSEPAAANANDDIHRQKTLNDIASLGGQTAYDQRENIRNQEERNDRRYARHDHVWLRNTFMVKTRLAVSAVDLLGDKEPGSDGGDDKGALAGKQEAQACSRTSISSALVHFAETAVPNVIDKVFAVWDLVDTDGTRLQAAAEAIYNAIAVLGEYSTAIEETQEHAEHHLGVVTQLREIIAGDAFGAMASQMRQIRSDWQQETQEFLGKLEKKSGGGLTIVHQRQSLNDLILQPLTTWIERLASALDSDTPFNALQTGHRRKLPSTDHDGDESKTDVPTLSPHEFLSLPELLPDMFLQCHKNMLLVAIYTREKAQLGDGGERSIFNQAQVQETSNQITHQCAVTSIYRYFFYATSTSFRAESWNTFVAMTRALYAKYFPIIMVKRQDQERDRPLVASGIVKSHWHTHSPQPLMRMPMLCTLIEKLRTKRGGRKILVAEIGVFLGETTARLLKHCGPVHVVAVDPFLTEASDRYIASEPKTIEKMRAKSGADKVRKKIVDTVPDAEEVVLDSSTLVFQELGTALIGSKSNVTSTFTIIPKPSVVAAGMLRRGLVRPLATSAPTSTATSESHTTDGNDVIAFDLIFIDGDHTYEGVSEDLAVWPNLVRPGGIVAGHDIDWVPVSAGVEAVFKEQLEEKGYAELRRVISEKYTLPGESARLAPHPSPIFPVWEALSDYITMSQRPRFDGPRPPKLELHVAHDNVWWIEYSDEDEKW